MPCVLLVRPMLRRRQPAMEKRLDAMLQAVKTIRPPLEAFVTLSDEQKARPDAPPGRMRFWRELW